MNKRRGLSAIIILILAVVVVYSAVQIVGILQTPPTVEDANPTVSKTIVRNGVEYFPRQDITVMMLLGIDQEGPVVESHSYNNTGEADVVALAVFDETNQEYSVLMLNRDTMLEMPVLGLGGKPAGTNFGQLALAHTYGSGLEDSCENTKKAVSDLLYGINIDYYLSMNMDAIALLTDSVGGVTVEVKDDFSQVDATIPMGEVTLTGSQARNYIQGRYNVGNQLNLNRMDRHKEYMEGFMTALGEKLQASDSFVLTTYDAMADYMVTDCSATTFNSLINRYSDYSMKEILSPVGENVTGQQYMEFHIDEAALDELVLELFYSEKNI